jgi:hypothetical protein
MQDHVQDHADRLAEPDQAAQPGVIQHCVRLADVVLDDRDPRMVFQHARVRDRDRVTVDVHHAGVRDLRAGYMVYLGVGRDTGAEVNEVLDAAPRHVGERPVQESPSVPDAAGDPVEPGREVIGRITIGGEVRVTPQPVVVDTRDVRNSAVGRQRC